MELGSNSPLIVMPDADLEKVAEATAATGFANAGQVCISAQRVMVNKDVYEDFIDVLRPRVEAMTTGDQLDESVSMGPMIRENDAERVSDWIHEASQGGARVIVGGDRNGTLHAPTVVADVDPRMRISCDELFGPAVGLTRFDTSMRPSPRPTTRITVCRPRCSPRIWTTRCSSLTKCSREI